MEKKYPVGVNDFAKIREEGFLYIDKTAAVYDLANNNYSPLLCRPRGFGKSLLISTLECYFQGRKELFEGLEIELLEKEWKHYPVIRINMGEVKTAKITEMKEQIGNQLQKYEEIYEIKKIYSLLSIRLTHIIETAYTATGLHPVVLIDDYDTPALYAAGDEDKAEEVMTCIESFLTPLKGEYLKFLFITGITRYPESTLRSGLNLSHKTLSPKYSAICGITEDEMLQEFSDGIQEIADANGWTKDECVTELRNNYGGYHFSHNSPEIYNPYSLLRALESKKIGQYWASTTPKYIIETIKEFGKDICSIGEIPSSEYWLYNQYVDSSTIPLLFQSGYFSIKSSREDIYGDTFIIDIPNKEVGDNLKEIMKLI